MQTGMQKSRLNVYPGRIEDGDIGERELQISMMIFGNGSTIKQRDKKISS
jgi:hypothetical protein